MKSINIVSRRERREAMRAARIVLDERLGAVRSKMALPQKSQADWAEINQMLEAAEDQSLFMVSLAMGAELTDE